MLIEAPCRLGERFTHNRSYSNPKEQYLVGIDLFVWHCNIDGVTLMGSPNKKGRVDFFERKYMDALPISFEVPDRLVEGDCRPEELGMEQGKKWKLRGIRLCGETGWAFSLSDMNRESRLVRTEVLDKLFAPVIPLVQVDLMDFL